MKSNFQLVNRESDKETVKDLISNSDIGILLFITAPSGIGKTIFTKHICEEMFPHFITMRVSSTAIKNLLKPDGFLIRELAKSLNEISKGIDNIRNHDSFSSSLASPSSKNKYNKELLGFIGIQKVFAAMYQKHTQSGDYDPLTIRDPAFTIDIQDLINYVRECFNLFHEEESQVLIVIENVHICDEMSLKFLSEVLYDCSRINVIFEYTIRKDNGDAYHISDIRAILSTLQNRFHIQPLKKLNKHCIRNLLRLWGVSEEILEPLLLAYDNVSGNIKKLEDIKGFADSDLGIVNHPDVKKIFDDVYKKIFLSLDESSSFLIVLLSCTNISLHKSLIIEICCIAESKGLLIDAGFAINTLKSKGGLIKESDNSIITLAHDSLGDAFKSIDSFSKKQIIVEGLILQLFEDILDNSKFDFVSRYDCLTILIRHYSFFQPPKLLTLFDYFKNSQMLDKAPAACESFLTKVKNLICNEKFEFEDGVFFNMLKVYYELDMFNLGFQVSKTYYGNNSVKLALFQAAFLNRTDNHIQCINVCKSILSNIDSNETTIDFLILLMTSYRSINNDKDCKKTYIKLKSIHVSLKKSESYALFLRNSQMVLTIEKSIRNLHKAMKIYRLNNNKIEGGKVNLTLSMEYARQGKLDIAEDYIRLASEDLLNRNIDQCMLLNNYAIIVLLKGNETMAIQKLIKAKNMAISYFDKIVITFNLINVYSQLDDSKMLKHYIPYLLSLLTSSTNQRDLALDRSVFFNISIIYKLNFYDYVNAEKYLAKAMAVLPISKGSYWSARFENGQCDDYLFTKKHHFGFLSHWSINLP